MTWIEIYVHERPWAEIFTASHVFCRCNSLISVSIALAHSATLTLDIAVLYVCGILCVCKLCLRIAYSAATKRLSRSNSSSRCTMASAALCRSIEHIVMVDFCIDFHNHVQFFSSEGPTLLIILKYIWWGWRCWIWEIIPMRELIFGITLSSAEILCGC